VPWTRKAEVLIPEGYSFIESPKLDEVCELINCSWTPPHWHYDPELLQRYLHRNTGSPPITLGIETNHRLIGYSALMPLDIDILGTKARAVFSSLLTIAPEHQGKGLAFVLKSILIKRAIENGYQIYLVICEQGGRAATINTSVFDKLGIPLWKARSFSYLAASNEVIESRLSNSRSGRTRRYQPADREALRSIYEAMGTGADLREHLQDNDVDMYFAEHLHSRTYVFENSRGLCAAANVLLLEVRATDSTSLNAYFENIAVNDLPEAEQAYFLGDILASLLPLGFHGAYVPDLGLAPSLVLKKFGFRQALRRFDLFATALAPTPGLRTSAKLEKVLLHVF
jgi:GNAT superfamily N-acetyltransferase